MLILSAKMIKCGSVHAQYAKHGEVNLRVALQQIPPVHLSMKTHFGNPASLKYQLNPSKQIFPSLLRDTEKLDKP